MREPAVEPEDRRLIQIVDAAMAEAVRKSGDRVVCRPGCTQCCMGPFAITPLDARRLRGGLAELRASDPARAGRVETRARAFVTTWFTKFPGDPVTGVLDDEDFPDFAEDAPCPALDPEHGTCDLYESRPLTCRIFGPAVRGPEGAIGACELCYQGVDEEKIEACAVTVDTADLESALTRTLEPGLTIVAWCLASAR